MARQKVADPGTYKTQDNKPGEAFRVKLKDNRAIVVKAGNAYEAVDKYKFACGIISTIHQFDVEPVELTDEARDLPLRPNAPVPQAFKEVTGREPELDLGTLGA